MLDGLTSNAIEQISIVEQLIDIHELAVEGKDPSTRSRMKVYAVSSCVTNLYAIYERFVESAISDYLDALPELSQFTELSSELRNEYRIGISYILSRIDNERYKNLGHENVIRWYHEALSNKANYRFVSEALTRHEQNLRLNSLGNLLAKIQLNELTAWLTNSPTIKLLYDSNLSIIEQLEAELKIFIQVRNDAAHGGLDDIEGKENLQRYCKLIRSLIESISAYMHKSLFTKRIIAKKNLSIGRVTEVFQNAGAFIAQLSDKSSIRVGMNIYFIGEKYYLSQKIESLKIDDEDVTLLVCPNDNFEVGIKCKSIPKKNTLIYIDAEFRLGIGQ